MATGRAMLFHGAGRPFEAVDAPVPTPHGAEILARVACCTICSSDLHTHAGRRFEGSPSVLGHEIVGRVAEFGPQAPRDDVPGTALAIGDRISWSVTAGCGTCFFCGDGLPQKCEHLVKYGHGQVAPDRPFSGGLAEFVLLAPGTTFVRVPDDMPDGVAAMAACAGATASAVVRAGGPKVAGGTVLIFGAGPLGLTACAMARAAGAAAVVVCDLDPGRRKTAAGFGATHGTSPEPDGLTATVGAVTAGRGADVVLELAGTAGAVRAAFDRVRIGGTLVLAGTVAPTMELSLDPETIVRRMVTVRGVHNYPPADLVAAIDFLAVSGRAAEFAALIGPTYRLADADAAFTYGHGHPGIRVAVVP